MAGSDSFYHTASLHNARQFNVIGVRQSDAISNDFIKIATMSNDIGCLLSPNTIPRRLGADGNRVCGLNKCASVSRDET